MGIVTDQDGGPVPPPQSVNERLDAGRIQIRGGRVEAEDLGVAQHGGRQTQSAAFPATQKAEIRGNLARTQPKGGALAPDFLFRLLGKFSRQVGECRWGGATVLLLLLLAENAVHVFLAEVRDIYV